MRPAFSVIFLTTLIGAGQGLFLALFAAEALAAFALLPATSPAFLGRGALFSLLLLVAGLAASFFHLGHPQRAWRAAAQWRTSWLSREVIVLPACMAVVAAYAALHLGSAATAPSGSSLLVGACGALLALLLFVCTAMVYACLPFLREWHSPLTVFNYILLGSASGFTLATALAAVLLPERVGFFAAGALLLTLAGLASRAASFVRNGRLKPGSTLQTALGIRHSRIVQKAQGAMGGCFNTREFFHGRSPAFLRRLQWLALGASFLLPGALLAGAAGSLAAPAFLVQYLGLLVERWLFFAQATHPQKLYYQCAA